MPEPIPLPAPHRHLWWHRFNWLALDAVLVAVAWLPVFGKMTGARLTMVNTVVLGGVVWLVYMLDRLLDSRVTQNRQQRHHFAGRHWKWLLPLLLVVGNGIVYLALYRMRWITVQAGLWIGAAVLMYFIVVAASRWKAVSQPLLLLMSSLMILGLVQGEQQGTAGLQLWRAVAVGTIATVLYFGLRFHYDPPPWTLVKKGMGGYLFALGVAVAPFSHTQDWLGLLRSAPVMLFAGACALNSLGIRLWEAGTPEDPESALLRRIYPWLLAAVGFGALAQAFGADPWTRPMLLGVAVCVAGFGAMHWGHRRWPSAMCGVTADAWMVLVALGVLWAGVPGGTG